MSGRTCLCRRSIYFPTFWDGENLDSANHKSHMAYADAAGGPSTHPYLLPQLELQIHYGRVPQDAQLILTSDFMTQDHPDYAPGWSLHADHIHLPWPEYDDDGNLYDGFERRVTDSMRFPIFAGTRWQFRADHTDRWQRSRSRPNRFTPIPSSRDKDNTGSFPILPHRS